MSEFESTIPTPATPATPLYNDQHFTPETPSKSVTRLSSAQIALATKTQLPFTTTYEEFEKFISGSITKAGSDISSSSSTAATASTSQSPGSPCTPDINNRNINGDHVVTLPDPKTFLNHLDTISHLEKRLNYRFLELEAKLRFLRLLTAGTETNKSEISAVDAESAQLQEKVDSLELQVAEAKKAGKTLRKKIGKCFHQTEIRRCIEGKSVLESEMKQMQNEIGEYRKYFSENGLDDTTSGDLDDVDWAKGMVEQELFGGEALLQKGVEKLDDEVKELKSKLEKLEASVEILHNEETELDTEIEALELEKAKLHSQLQVLESHEITPEELELIEKKKNLQILTSAWKSF
jgi:predicted  nucleic acid-binding Zn-ribbon protein